MKLETVKTRIKKLNESLLKYEDAQITKELISHLSKIVRKTLRLGPHSDNIWRSLEPLLGSRLTKNKIDKLKFILACNRQLLRKRHVIGCDIQPADDPNAIVYIESANMITSTLRARVVSGIHAGDKIELPLANNIAEAVAIKVGMKTWVKYNPMKEDKKYLIYRNLSDFVGLLLGAHIKQYKNNCIIRSLYKLPSTHGYNVRKKGVKYHDIAD